MASSDGGQRSREAHPDVEEQRRAVEEIDAAVQTLQALKSYLTVKQLGRLILTLRLSLVIALGGSIVALTAFVSRLPPFAPQPAVASPEVASGPPAQLVATVRDFFPLPDDMSDLWWPILTQYATDGEWRHVLLSTEPLDETHPPFTITIESTVPGDMLGAVFVRTPGLERPSLEPVEDFGPPPGEVASVAIPGLPAGASLWMVLRLPPAPQGMDDADTVELRVTK